MSPPKKLTHDVSMALRISRQDRERIGWRAAGEERTVSAWIREAVREKLERDEK